MMRIGVDLTGGDNGSKPIVPAILEFLSKNSDVQVTAFGNK